MKLQIVYFQISLIDFGSGIQGCIHVHSSLSFFQTEICFIFRTFDIHFRHQIHAVRNDKRTIRRFSRQSGQEVQVLSGHFQADGSGACEAVGEVFQKATALQCKSTRQVYRETGNLHFFQIAVRAGTDDERTKWIGFFEAFGQTAGKQHDVFFADIGIETGG